MIVLPIIGFLITGAANYICALFGFSNFKTGDKDIVFPFSSTLFLFFSLLIYLPEVHGKILSLQKQSPNETKQMEAQQQQQQFPIAFLLSLLAFTLAIFLDRFCLNKQNQEKQQDQRNLRPGQSHSTQEYSNHAEHNKKQVATLKYFLSLSVLFINLFSAYFITLQHKQSSIWEELFIFFVFSSILNFSYGFLLAWSGINEQLASKLFVFVNSGILAGLIIAASLEASLPIVILPCIAVGFSIYTSIFICFPKVFTNGQKPNQDKFRFWAIFTALLLTIIYYPILYLLKI